MTDPNKKKDEDESMGISGAMKEDLEREQEDDRPLFGRNLIEDDESDDDGPLFGRNLLDET